MARKKKKSKQRTKRTGPGLGARIAASGASRAVLALACITVAVGAIIFGAARLEAHAAGMLEKSEITFAWPVVVELPDGAGEWPPESMRRRLLTLARGHLAAAPDPLSGHALSAIGTAVDQTGLFAETPTVRRAGDGLIEIQGRWRAPMAAVRYGGQDMLVGAGGDLLPVSLEPGQESYRVIRGAAFNPPTNTEGDLLYGQPWPGEDVQGALAILDLVRSKPYWSQVRGIQIGKHGGRPSFEIVTDEHTRIVWGAPPGTFAPGEVDTETKLGHLRALFERYGRIDAGQQRVTVFYEYTGVDRSATGDSP